MRFSRGGLVAVYLVAAAAVVFTQSPPTPSQALKFDVVSVKPCDPNVPPPAASRGVGASPGRLRLDCRRVVDLIQTAYVVYANGNSKVPAPRPDFDRISGSPSAPDWVRTDLFTIEGRTDAVPPPVPAVLLGPMLRAALEDRFKLKMEHELREAPIFELIVSKGGSKLTPFKPGTCVPYDMSVSPQPPLQPGERRCSNHVGERDVSSAAWIDTMEAISLDQVATGFGGGPGQTPIINKTGIAGLVSYRLVMPDGDPLGTVLKDQLGLELRPAKAMRDFLVIGHVERPTPD